MDKRRPRAARLVTLVLLGALGSAVADEERYAEERAEFRAALAAVGRADEARDSRALRRYPLHPYLEAARLERALRATTVADDVDERAADFLERHGGEPVGAKLRRTWLASLGRREEWRTYLEHYRDDADAALRCHALNARIATIATAEPSAVADLEADIVRRWLTPRQLPSECERAFTWLRDRGGLGPDLIEERVRLLLEAGQPSFARVIARRLPAERSAMLSRWADLLERPAGTLDALLATPTAELETDALLDGFRRLAR